MKWLFCCHDAAVRFSVIFTDAKTKESVFVEEEHRVKGDGRYDTYACKRGFIVEEIILVKNRVC